MLDCISNLSLAWIIAEWITRQSCSLNIVRQHVNVRLLLQRIIDRRDCKVNIIPVAKMVCNALVELAAIVHQVSWIVLSSWVECSCNVACNLVLRWCMRQAILQVAVTMCVVLTFAQRLNCWEHDAWELPWVPVFPSQVIYAMYVARLLPWKLLPCAEVLIMRDLWELLSIVEDLLIHRAAALELDDLRLMMVVSCSCSSLHAPST